MTAAFAANNYLGTSTNVPTHTSVGSFADPALAAEVKWIRSASAGLPIWVVLLPSAALGSSPAATIYAQHTGDTGEVTDIVLNRTTGQDETGLYGYTSDATDASTELGVGGRTELLSSQTLHAPRR